MVSGWMPSCLPRVCPNMKRPFLSTLRARLLALVMLALLPAAGLIIYSGLEQRQDANGKVREDAGTLAEVGVAEQEQLIEGSRQLLVSVALLTSAIDLGAASPRRVAPGSWGGSSSSSRRTQTSASPCQMGTSSAAAFPTTEVVNAADRAWFQRAVETRGFSVGDYQIGRITGLQTVNFSYPIVLRTGELKAVVFLAVDLAYLNQTFATEELPNGALFILFDRNGTVLARSSDPEQWVGTTVPDEMLLGAIEGDGKTVSELPGVDGVKRMYAFSPVTSSGTGLYLGVGIPRDVAFLAANQQLRRNLLALGAVAVLALCAAWFGGDAFLLRRTHALVATTQRLRAGDFSARTGQPHDGSELGLLASSFDEMAETLERRESERDAAQAELAERNEELESFTYSVSHDLKEPLRTVKTYSQFLLQDYRDVVDDEGKEFLDGIGAASVRMARLIDELLVLSKLSKEAPAARVDIGELLQGIVQSLAGAIDAKKAKVTVEPGLPAVYAHSPRVHQILTNLISNALKFNESDTPDG